MRSLICFRTWQILVVSLRLFSPIIYIYTLIKWLIFIGWAWLIEVYSLYCKEEKKQLPNLPLPVSFCSVMMMMISLWWCFFSGWVYSDPHGCWVDSWGGSGAADAICVYQERLCFHLWAGVLVNLCNFVSTPSLVVVSGHAFWLFSFLFLTYSLKAKKT